MKKILLLSLATVLISPAYSQSISSFNYATISGVTPSSAGLNLSVSVAPGATLTYNSNTYTITDVFGVWSLDDNSDMTATGVNSGVWSFHTNNGGGGKIAGWKTNPNTGITPGGNVSLNYSSLAGTVEDIGYHIRVDGTIAGTNGNTAYFRQAPVPEPTTLGILTLASLFALKRKKK